MKKYKWNLYIFENGEMSIYKVKVSKKENFYYLQENSSCFSEYGSIKLNMGLNLFENKYIVLFPIDDFGYVKNLISRKIQEKMFETQEVLDELKRDFYSVLYCKESELKD